MTNEVSQLKVRSTLYSLKDEGARQTKLDKNMGVTYAGKYLKVGDDGIVRPSAGSTSTVVWGNITGTISNQIDLQTALNGKQDTLTFDTTPTAGSNNPVTSNGINESISRRLDRFQGAGNVGKVPIVSSGGWLGISDLPKATDSSLGVVKPDGTSITVDGNGVISSTGSSSVAWGSISGTLSNQTDLQTALDGKENSIGTKGSAFNKNFGNTSGTVCQGDDSRLSDSRTPTTHSMTHMSGSTDPISINASQVTLGILSADRLPRASTTEYGIVKPDGTSVRVAVSGKLEATPKWGSITGILSNQTDLSNYLDFLTQELDDKVEISETTGSTISMSMKSDGWLYVSDGMT